MDTNRIESIVRTARSDGREILLETEGLQLLETLGFEPPSYVLVSDSASLSIADLEELPGQEVVVKVVSPDIVHKAAVGGVAFVPKSLETVRSVVSEMERAFRGRDLRGFLVVERVIYKSALGAELLLGLRWTEDFGPVVAFGAGGAFTEFLARSFKPGVNLALVSAIDLDATTAMRLLDGVALTSLIGGTKAGKDFPGVPCALVDAFVSFAELARETAPHLIRELEVNPFVAARDRLVPLDVLVRCGDGVRVGTPKRPVHKIRHLLKPRSIAVIGVSDRPNPGRLILENTLRAGFPNDRISVVKPGSDTVAGCRCYPDLSSLPEPVDLLVLAVSATQVPDLLGTVIAEQKAESVILVPGGLEEKDGSEDIVATIGSRIEEARATTWGGPVINGGNCLGVRSRPGGYDATFIPDFKLPQTRAAPVALISQSGAFAVAKTSKLGFQTRYSISVGNQMDLTIGDYLWHLRDDLETEVYAVYAEGFRRLDGLRFLAAAREITARNGTVILYRGGRTAAGTRASASHTAAVAGDYAVMRQLAEQVGVLVCETTQDFEDFVRLAALLGPVPANGRRLGALTNAGFECVSVADHLGDLELASFDPATGSRLARLMDRCRLSEILDVRNPLDVSPMMDDAAFEQAARIVMADANVDIGFVGCVPLTPALQTLPRDRNHDEDLFADGSIAQRLIRLRLEIEKPWVVAVDGGAMYDPFCRLLQEHGVPTFRSTDRALEVLSRFCSARKRVS